MSAAPTDLTSDMAAIAEHHEEGIRLHREGAFTEEEWSEHQRITYAAMLVLGIDGMKRLGETLLRPRRAMTYTERMNSGMQPFN
jgi:hypothetical protein